MNVTPSPSSRIARPVPATAVLALAVVVVYALPREGGDRNSRRWAD